MCCRSSWLRTALLSYLQMSWPSRGGSSSSSKTHSLSAGAAAATPPAASSNPWGTTSRCQKQLRSHGSVTAAAAAAAAATSATAVAAAAVAEKLAAAALLNPKLNTFFRTPIAFAKIPYLNLGFGILERGFRARRQAPNPKPLNSIPSVISLSSNVFNPYVLLQLLTV